MTEKERLWINIKLVGAFYGEDAEFLKEYAKEVYENNKNDLKKAIECFEDLLKQTKWVKYDKTQKSVTNSDGA